MARPILSWQMVPSGAHRGTIHRSAKAIKMPPDLLQDHHRSGDGEQRAWHSDCSSVSGVQWNAADLLPYHAAEAQPCQP